MQNRRLNIKKRWNNNRRTVYFCAAAFGMTLAAAMLVAVTKGFFPFGKQSVYYSDLIYEFSIFLTEFWRKVHTGGSLLYSWKTGLGGVFWGNLLDYVSSPFNLLVLLVKEEHIDEAVAVLICLRQALAAAFMCWFLCRRRGGQPSLAGVLCGFLYSACGWFCGYYFIIIYLDIYMLTPLLLLGVERIIDRRRPGLYFAVFALMLFSNFYLTYAAAMFAVVYWLYYFFANYRFRERREGDGQVLKAPFLRSRFFTAGLTFAVSSVLAVLCLAFLFVPLLLQLSRNDANNDVASAAALFSNVTQQVSAMFSGALSQSNTFQHYPAVYTGVLVFAAAPLFFFLKAKTRREKIAMAALVLLMALSFNLPSLDYVWHGFRFPTNFPFRQGFLFSVVLSMIVYGVLKDIASLSPKGWFALIGSAAVIAVCGAVELLTREEDSIAVSLADVIVTGVLFLLFCGMLALLRFGKKEQAAAAMAFIFFFSFGDVAYTLLSNVQLAQVHADSESEKEKMDQLKDKIADDGLFYRTETTFPWVINDGAFFDYNGVRQSSSVTAASTLKLLKDLGCDSNKANYVGYEAQTAVFNSIFGLRYLIESSDYVDYSSVSYLSCAGESYRVADTVDKYTAYRFDNALSLGFAADAALTEWEAAEASAEVNQSTFYAAAAGSDESVLFYCDEDLKAEATADHAKVKELGDHRYAIERTASDTEALGGVSLTLKAKTSGLLYVSAEKTEGAFNTMSIWTTNGEVGNRPVFSTVSDSICRAVYNAKKGEELSVCVSPVADTPCTLRIRVFQIDPAVFARQHEAIAKGGELVLTDFSDTHFEGTVDVTGNDRVLCVTVPFDPGWTVTLDGKRLSDNDYSLIDGALYGIPVEEGTHTVSFDYALPGLPAGIVVSLCAVVVSAGAFLVLRKKHFLSGGAEPAPGGIG